MLQTSTVQITPEMLSLVAEIDEFKGAWRALGTLAPERLSALRRVATIESIGSSTRIEVAGCPTVRSSTCSRIWRSNPSAPVTSRKSPATRR